MILVSDWLAFHADRTPDKIAMIDQGTGRQFTYAQFNERATRLATFMREAWGIQHGDRVAILAKNSTDYFEFQFACFKLGAIMLPLNWRLAEPELLYILNDARPVGLVYGNDFTDSIAALVEQSPIQHCLRLDLGTAVTDDSPTFEDAIAAYEPTVVMSEQITHNTPCTIMYTSGTTGRPKGAIMTQGMTFWNAANISIPTGLNKDSVQYTVLPTFHTGGLNLYANPILHFGGTNIIAREFDPALTLKTLSDPDLGVTHFLGVPAIYLFLSQHPDFDQTDLSNIVSWGCGGAPMPVALLKIYSERGIIIQPGFGMTETSPTVFLSDKRRSLEKPSSVGREMLHTRVKIVNDDFKEMPIGELGEIVLTGPNITPGYWNRPDANAASFTEDEHGARWLHSGDAGYRDDDGAIFVVDRYKDMYISGGENVYPAEVEQVIHHLPTVGDVAVIGVPDEKWGESGLAIVVPAVGKTVTEDEIIEACRQNLAKFKVPKGVRFIDELPRNAAGKILKRELKAQFGDA
jgi:fatty-acyl-CoA synthase